MLVVFNPEFIAANWVGFAIRGAGKAVLLVGLFYIGHWCWRKLS